MGPLEMAENKWLTGVINLLVKTISSILAMLTQNYLYITICLQFAVCSGLWSHYISWALESPIQPFHFPSFLGVAITICLLDCLKKLLHVWDRLGRFLRKRRQVHVVRPGLLLHSKFSTVETGWLSKTWRGQKGKNVSRQIRNRDTNAFLNQTNCSR